MARDVFSGRFLDVANGTGVAERHLLWLGQYPLAFLVVNVTVFFFTSVIALQYNKQAFAQVVPARLAEVAHLVEPGNPC